MIGTYDLGYRTIGIEPNELVEFSIIFSEVTYENIVINELPVPKSYILSLNNIRVNSIVLVRKCHNVPTVLRYVHRNDVLRRSTS